MIETPQEEIKIPEELQKKIEEIRGQITIRETESLNLKKIIISQEYTIGENEKRKSELELQNSNLEEKYSKKEVEYKNLEILFDSKKLDQDTLDKNISEKTEEYKTKEIDFSERENRIASKEKEINDRLLKVEISERDLLDGQKLLDNKKNILKEAIGKC